MPDNIAQRRSKSYRLPVEDTEFLLRDEMRAVRFALEYAKAELSLRDWGCARRLLSSAARKPPRPNRQRPCCARRRGRRHWSGHDAASGRRGGTKWRGTSAA